jgi:hypothetical protein
MQAVYSSATISATTFYDGRRATGTINVGASTQAVVGCRIIIGNYAITEGVDWVVGSSSRTTAQNLYSCIKNNPALSALVASTCSATSTVIYTTATAVGSSYNYALWASTPAVTLSASTMLNGTDSSIDYTNDTISKSNNGFTTGLPVLFTVTAGTCPTNLAAGTTYYAIPTSASLFKLGSSAANAVAGTAIDIQKVAADGSSTFVLTPLAPSGTAYLVWQCSNDGTNFANVNCSSVTLTAPISASNTTWDFATVTFRYLRAQFTAATGAVKLKIVGYGKRTR